ncbi:leucine-rich repeat neuronal protein 4 [Lampris incognitus]|uniref:leucine-rich repeat neuronal protein 4 n=1 Tax=Lampris incognitus TaxID=2546036 RepID=UPI0024B5741E|nr:leucine-rich repeat neuronal protein 4 [Lampris incognitus]XP_056147237.1 leucine-rich repeat neuronal protein 4 [Lampris incognitus]
MTSLCKNLAVLLLLVSSDSFLRSASPYPRQLLFTHAASTSPPVTHKRIMFVMDVGDDDDYDDDYSDGHSSPTSASPSKNHTPLLQDRKPCHYDSCEENHGPCEHLSAQTGCLCPGLSGDDIPPHPPRLKGLVPVSDGDSKEKVEIQWCAPSSVVSGYRVMVEGHSGGPLQFGEASRRGTVESLEVGAKVCVEAVNKAGHSMRSDFSCLRYNPSKSSRLELSAGVIAGGVAFLLLLFIAAFILWKRKMCQKATSDSAEGHRNPSYSTEGPL